MDEAWGVVVVMAAVPSLLGDQLTVWASATRRLVVAVRSSGARLPLAATTPLATQVMCQVVVAVTG
jgi:hypothetical protein